MGEKFRVGFFRMGITLAVLNAVGISPEVMEPKQVMLSLLS